MESHPYTKPRGVGPVTTELTPGAEPTAAQPPIEPGDRDCAAIRIENLARHYQMGSAIIRAVDGISLEVHPGDFVAVLGASGRGRERVLCILAMDALEKAAQSNEVSEPALRQIFDAHRLMIEIRAAQKLNAGLFDSNGSVLVGADDI